MRNTSAIILGVSIVAGFLIVGLLVSRCPADRDGKYELRVIRGEGKLSDMYHAIIFDPATGRGWISSNRTTNTYMDWTRFGPPETAQQQAPKPGKR